MTRARQSRGEARIDVHTHMIPREYVRLLGTLGIKGTPGRDFPKWSPKKTLKVMDKCGIASSILSLSSPGTYFQDDAFSRQLARVCNEYGARLMADYPGRFGAFASLPLPDVEGARRELEYALDTLGLDGVVLMSNVHGVYPGDPRYDELFVELDRRKAVVFIHPNDPKGTDDRYPALTPLLEWPLETTRAATRLLTTGTLARFPNIRFILAHGGGGVPFLAERIASATAPSTAPDRSVAVAADIRDNLESLRGLYYDTAQPGEAHLACIQELVDDDHILFGTDGGWSTGMEIGLTVKVFNAYDGFDDAQVRAVNRDNALPLFPRIQSMEA